MSELAGVEVERLRGLTVVSITGEVDASNASRVQRQMLEAVGHEGAGLIVDLSATGYLDSAGIRILFDVGERLKIRGMEMRLVATPGSFTADVLGTVGMADRFAVDDAVERAVEAVVG